MYEIWRQRNAEKTDRTIPNNKPDIIIRDNERGTCMLTLILRRSRTGTVWFYTSTSNKRAARPKLYTKYLKLMYSRFTGENFH